MNSLSSRSSNSLLTGSSSVLTCTDPDRLLGFTLSTADAEIPVETADGERYTVRRVAGRLTLLQVGEVTDRGRVLIESFNRG